MNKPTPTADRPLDSHHAYVPATAPPAGAGPRAEDYEDLGAAPKPDVFEYFSQRATRHRELEQEVERLKLREASLNRRLQDTDLRASRLQSEVSGAAARHEAREAQLQLQKQQLEAAMRREMERAATFEVELQKVGQQTPPLGRGGEPSIDDSTAPDTAAAKAEDTCRQLKIKVTELEFAVVSAKAEADDRRSHVMAELERERQLRAAEAAAATALCNQLAEVQSVADAAAVAKRDAEARCASLEALALSAETQGTSIGHSSDGEAVLIKSLREQLRVAEATAAAADTLRGQVADARALREKLEGAEGRARRAEQLLDSEQKVHSELATLKEELMRWNAVFANVRDCSTPEDVLALVKRLQDKQIADAAGAGDLAEAVAAARADVEAANTAAKEAETAAQLERDRANVAATACARAERHAELLRQERDSLKSVLASYDEEYLTQNNGETNELQPTQRRIAELEATVEALHAHVAILEAEVRSGSVSQAGRVDVAAQASARAEAAEARVRITEAEAENLHRQVALLQDRVGRGEFNPETTRVLHLRNNPEAEVQQAAHEARVAELESENQALRENIQRIEMASTGGGDRGGGSLRIAQLEGEANLLRKRLAEGQKATDRLQQVFTRQITTFREAMLGLFGYRVEMISDPGSRDQRGQFTLRPQYVDEPGAEIAFRMLRDGRLVLVPTDYSARRLAREVETFLNRFKSIPAFTANLTMETFQRQTQG